MPLRRIYLLTTALLVALFSLVGIFSTTYLVATSVLNNNNPVPTVGTDEDLTVSDTSTTTPYKPSRALVELNAKLLKSGKCRSVAPPEYAEYQTKLDEYQAALQDERVAKDGFITPSMPIRLEVSCDFDNIVVTGSIEQILTGAAPELGLKDPEASWNLVTDDYPDFATNIKNIEITTDYNFDGYNDLRSLYYPAKSSGYAYFLFDPKSKQFVPSKELTSTSDLRVERNIIAGYGGVDSSVYRQYSWNNGRLIQRYRLDCGDYSWDKKSAVPPDKNLIEESFYDEEGVLVSTTSYLIDKSIIQKIHGDGSWNQCPHSR